MQGVLRKLPQGTGIGEDFPLCMDFAVHSTGGLGISQGQTVPHDCEGSSGGSELCFAVGN